MSPKKLLLLGIALAAGLGTVTLARQILQPPPPPPAPAPQQVAAPAPAPELRILVAARGRPAGHLIVADDLVWRVWDRDDERLPSYFLEGEETPAALHGAVVRRGIAGDAPIVRGRVVKPGEQGFLAAVMEPGLRAVSVRINPVTGIAGLVFPGDRVDLLLTQRIQRPNDPERAERFASETVLTNLRVLAIDQSTNDQTATPTEAEVVTLEVTPKQAELVTLMSELGQLSLSLRALQGAPEQQLLAQAQPQAHLQAQFQAETVPPAGPRASAGVQLHGALGHGLSAAQSAGAINRLASVGTLSAPLAEAAGALDAAAATDPGAGAPDRRLSPELAAAMAEMTPGERAAVLRSLNDNPYSWDSDVSLLLPDPADAKAAVRRVQVIRGPEAALVPFQR
ncbi:hypothetical protein AY600_08530 [Phormidium willei BDU 130791]|nr:hypothetical protein AY600_08530 [Phormidium willei BDU 130791]